MCINTTEYGKPFTVDGFSGWMRVMTEVVFALDCRPHGLRKTLGRLPADAGATTHQIMAALGYLTLAEERYTREADRRRVGSQVIAKLEDHKANRIPQICSNGLGKLADQYEKEAADTLRGLEAHVPSW